MIAIVMTGLATILLLLVPFIPGLRDIPRLVPVHKLIGRHRDSLVPGSSAETGPVSTKGAGPAQQP